MICRETPQRFSAMLRAMPSLLPPGTFSPALRLSKCADLFRFSRGCRSPRCVHCIILCGHLALVDYQKVPYKPAIRPSGDQAAEEGKNHNENKVLYRRRHGGAFDAACRVRPTT